MFFRFLLKEQFFELGELSLQFHGPKQMKKLPQFITPDELDRMKQTVTGNAMHGKTWNGFLSGIC